MGSLEKDLLLILIPALGLAIGIGFLLFSADRFVLWAASTAKHLGLPDLLVGMLVIGFGTSVPEATVSAIAALQGNSALALGNAYGSNIANTGLVLGLSALVSPIAVSSTVLRKELPLLLAATILAVIQLQNKSLTRLEAWALLQSFSTGTFLSWPFSQDPYSSWAMDSGLQAGSTGWKEPCSCPVIWDIFYFCTSQPESARFIPAPDPSSPAKCGSRSVYPAGR
ncbi:MAG: sodium:calcium antiporter [Desulfohalobiaceae bacterium]